MEPIPEIGRTLSHYRLIEKIGEGGMGVVWKAEDTLLGRTVAVKLLPADLARDERRRKMFLDEARLASSVSEAHIVQVFDFGREGDLDFIVMEHVEGKPLNKILKGKSLPPDRIAEIGQQVARALSRAHRRGLLHRDLKPSNILITPDGDAKVVDFGLAALFARGESAVGGASGAPSEAETLVAHETPENRGIAGTVPYMSPEQARGEDLDARSDIFSLGVVLYEMTTGQRPFSGLSLPDVAKRIQEGRPRAVHELVPEVPLELERSIHKALEAHRGDRYQTMDDLAVDLKRLARELESGSSPSYASTTTGLRRRGAWRWAVAAGAVLVAAAVGMALWLLPSRPGGSPAARTILIFPMEVRGQTEGADFLGRAFAEAIAVNLTRWKDLKVLPVSESKEIGEAGGTSRAGAARSQGAGILLAGALTRTAGKVEASVSLIDTAENRMLWGAQKIETEAALSSLASSVAQDLAAQLGLAARKLYGYRTELYGGPRMSVSPELAETMAALRADDWKAYREVTERLVRAFPDEPDAWIHRMVALSNSYSPGEIPARRKEVEACLAALKRLDPQHPQLEVQPAFNGGNWDYDYRGAVEVYTKVLRRSDLTPLLRAGILIKRASSEATIGDSDAAMADFQEAIHLAPSENDVRYNGALTLLRLARFEEAIQFARQAVVLRPNRANQMLLGWILLHAGKVEESLEPLSIGCDATSPPESCGYYGWALSLSGRHGEALSLLSPLCGSHQAMCSLYATALLRAGKREVAEETFRKTTSLPESDTVYDRASYQAVAGNKAEALRLLRRALDLGLLISLGENAYDPDFASLRGDPEFEKIMAEVEKGNRRPGN